MRSRLSAWALALAMATLILVFQGLTSSWTSGIFLYLLLAAQAVWFLGAAPGMAVTCLTVIAGALISGVGVESGSPPGLVIQAWNLASLLLSVGLIGFLLTGLRHAIEVERWRASTDQLTGALNRAAFEERIAPALRRAEARGDAVVLAYMDLDGFKSINDRHGHAAGNRVLATFARAAESALRTTDIFARIGGDEFAALLTVPSCLEGDRVAELLHLRLSAVLDGTGFAVTCSMGALVMDARGMLCEEAIIEQADRLMYVAKESGKNALHIGRGDALERALRAAFPRPAPAITTMRHWAEHADRKRV